MVWGEHGHCFCVCGYPGWGKMGLWYASLWDILNVYQLLTSVVSPVEFGDLSSSVHGFLFTVTNKLPNKYLPNLKKKRDHRPWLSGIYSKNVFNTFPFQKWFNTCKPVNVIHHINKMKDLKKIIWSISVWMYRKSIWQNSISIYDKNFQYPFLIKGKHWVDIPEHNKGHICQVHS